MNMISKASLAAVALAACPSYAREVTGISFAQDMTSATVALTAGEAGDGHILYLAYGASDFGDTLYAWANGGGYVACGNIPDDAVEAVVEIPEEARDAACYRAFLVKKLQEPAYTTKLLDCIREDNGYAWFTTDYFCTGDESITAVFSGLRVANKRPFGSRSPDATSVFEVYHGTGSGWGYLYLDHDNPGDYKSVSWAFSDRTYDGKVALTLDTKNKKYMIDGYEDAPSDLKATKSIPDTNLFLDGADKSPYPLCIFGTANSDDGSTIVGHYPPENSLLYRFWIKNGEEYAHYYIPAVSKTSAKNGCLWDAVENKVVESSRRATDTFERSVFRAKDATGAEYQELDFHAVVPAELQEKYEKTVSTFSVGRRIVSMSVGKSEENQGRIAVALSFAGGAAGERDVVYIAWGDEDMGDTLSAWGENVYCAGEVEEGAETAEIVLPSGKYPLSFRAFLMKVSALDCDGFEDHLLSDGNSYVKTDWFHVNGDIYKIEFSIEEFLKDCVLFGCGYTGGKSHISLYQSETASADGHFYRPVVDGDNGLQWNSTTWQQIPARTGKTDLSYDSGTGLLKAEYGDGTSYQFTFTAGLSSESMDPTGNASLWLFASRRTQKNWMPDGSRFYSMSISRDGEIARYYVPAVKNGVYGVWDAVENKFTAPAKAFLAPADSSGEPCAPVEFLDAVPQELQGKYLSRASTASARRKRDGMAIRLR